MPCEKQSLIGEDGGSHACVHTVKKSKREKVRCQKAKNQKVKKFKRQKVKKFKRHTNYSQMHIYADSRTGWQASSQRDKKMLQFTYARRDKIGE